MNASSSSAVLGDYSFMTEELVSKVLYADWFHIKNKTAEEKRKIRRRWYKDFLFSEFDIPENRSVEFVFFRSLVRDDYKQLFHSIIDASEVADYVVIEDYKNRRVRLNPRHARHLLDVWPLREKIRLGGAVDRSCLIIRLAMYTYVLSKLKQLDFKRLVCFADMQPVEHLLASYFRATGIPTITLQHGLYVEYLNWDTVNRINYLHQPSEYFLAWGKSTAELIKKYHPDTKMHICGKPQVFTAKNGGVVDKNRCGGISVFLDQKPFDLQNREMLTVVMDFANRTGQRVYIRFHPSLDKNSYFSQFPEVEERLSFTEAEFVVGHTSSLIYEAISLGCRAFRYKTEVPAIPLPDDCTFSTVEELVRKSTRPQPEGLSQEFIVAMGDESKERYRQFFQVKLAGYLEGFEANVSLGGAH
jgi:hypothetical protein